MASHINICKVKVMLEWPSPVVLYIASLMLIHYCLLSWQGGKKRFKKKRRCTFSMLVKQHVNYEKGNKKLGVTGIELSSLQVRKVKH